MQSKKNIDLMSIPFLGVNLISVSFWFPFLQNEKEIYDPGNEAGFKKTSQKNNNNNKIKTKILVNFNLDPRLTFSFGNLDGSRFRNQRNSLWSRLENISPSMHKKCSHSEFFWSVLSRIPTRKNPNTATFHAVRVPQG